MIDVQVGAVSHRQMTVIGKCMPVEFQLRFDVTEIIYWFPLLRLGEVSSRARSHMRRVAFVHRLGKRGDDVLSINLNAPNSSGPCRVNFTAINLFLPIAALLNSTREDPRTRFSTEDGWELMIVRSWREISAKRTRICVLNEAEGKRSEKRYSCKRS